MKLDKRFNMKIKLERNDLFVLRDACQHAQLHSTGAYKKEYQDMFHKLGKMIEEIDKR